jgi:hypothetical protein
MERSSRERGENYESIPVAFCKCRTDDLELHPRQVAWGFFVEDFFFREVKEE